MVQDFSLLLLVCRPPRQWMCSTAAFNPLLWWAIGALALLFGLAEEGRKWLIRRQSAQAG